MQTIGNCLKNGREARNIELSEVARSTKISKWYLDCLEKDEFDKIPGGPYIKGYIASYASFIGIEEDEILKRYDSLQIDSTDEIEIQDHRPQDKKSQKSIGFSFSRKNLFILSMAVLILLAFGFTYFFFQNKTYSVAKVKDSQDSKLQSAPSAKINQGETRSVPPVKIPNDNSVQSAKLKDFTKNDEPLPTYQDATELESSALLPSEQDSAKNAVKRPALTDSNNALRQDTPETADLYLESAPGYRTPDARPQAANSMRVIRAVAASDVINKNPAGLGDSFQWSMEKVYIWTMIECEQPPSSIRHTYYFKGQKVNDIVLKVKSPQWRTWSYKTLLEKRYIGRWRVDITSVEGKLLQSVFFEVN
jgi:cytoskeletal protein RodZ